MRESALARAAGLDMELKAGRWRGRLHGIPVALKDIIDTAGIRTTAASAVFTDRVPNADATVVARLKEGGAVIIGKNNLYEFAMRGSYFAPALNPWASGPRNRRLFVGLERGGFCRALLWRASAPIPAAPFASRPLIVGSLG